MKAWLLGARPISSPRTVVLFTVAVLLQIWFLFTLGAPGKKEPFTLLIAAAAAAPLAAIILFLFLFPRRVLLAAPLLILLPVQLVFVHAFEWVFLAALLAILLRETPGHLLRVHLRAIDIVFLVYLLWALLAVTQAEDLGVALVGLKQPILFFLAFWAGSRVLGSRGTPALLRVYALVAVGVALEILIAAAVGGVPIRSLTVHMGKLTNLGWGQSNYVAAVAALAAVAAFPMALHRRGRDRGLALAGVIAASFVAAATVSRGGTLALALGLVFGFATARRHLGLAVVVLGGLAAAYLFSPFGQAGIARFIRPEELPSIGVRFLFYREALWVALTHPILGVGPDQIPFHTYFYMDANPHNILLKQAADLGFVGLGFYLLLLGLLAKQVLALYRGAVGADEKLRAQAILLGFSVAMINASYEPTLEGPQYGFLFWLLAGALTALPPVGGEDRPT